MPPLVISHRDSNTQRIAALDERAEALKLKRGMGIADARAMHPGIDVVEADPEADRRLLEGLADWCDRYTPLVALDGADGLFLDITGCAHLFGGEEAMLDDHPVAALPSGFRRPRRACLDAGCCLGGGAVLPAAGHPIGIGGEEEALLAPLPLSALRLEPATRDGLESVGLRTVGRRHVGAARAARPPLRQRAAPAPRPGARPRSRRRSRRACRSRRCRSSGTLPSRSSLTEDIERLVAMLAGTLKTDLERRGEGARPLQLLLFRVDGAVSRIAVGTSRPLREPRADPAGCSTKGLPRSEGDIDAGYGFDLVRLSVLAVAPFDDAADRSGRRG